MTRHEYVPTRRDNIGDLVINAFILIGILLAFTVVSGFVLGGYRVSGAAADAEPDADVILYT